MKNKLQFIVCFCILASASNSLFSQWTIDPHVNTPVCVHAGEQIEQRLLSDGTGGVFVVWRDYRNGSPDIYIQRLNKDGIALWTTNGVGACTYAADQSTPSIVTDMNGGCIVAWSDWRSSIERDLYAQRIDSNGTVLWTTDGVVVTNKPEREHSERMTSDGAGGAIVVWEQQSNIDYSWDVWCQRISSSGTQMWPSGGKPLTTSSGERKNARVQADGFGGAFFTWQDYRNGNDYDIYAQHMDASGARLWGGAGVPVCTAVNSQVDPKIDPAPGVKGCYITWIDKRNGSDYDIYAQKLDSTGAIQWALNGAPVVTASGNQSASDFASNGGVSGIIVTWKDDRGTNYDIYAQRLNGLGTQMWTNNGVVICNATGDQLNPNVQPDTTGGAIIVWQDHRANSWDIAAQRIDSNGNVLWTTNGVQVSIASGNQTSAKNCSDGRGGTIIVFQDTRNGNTDLYAQHLFDSGSADAVSIIANESLIEVFPNPFSNQINLNTENTNLTEKLFTVTGQVVYQGNNIGAVDFSQLSAGLYFLTIENIQTGFASTVKLIKN